MKTIFQYICLLVLFSTTLIAIGATGETVGIPVTTGSVFPASMGYNLSPHESEPRKIRGELWNSDKYQDMWVELPVPKNKYADGMSASVEIVDQNPTQPCYCFLYHYPVYSRVNSVTFRMQTPENTGELLSWTSSNNSRTDTYGEIKEMENSRTIFKCFLPKAVEPLSSGFLTKPQNLGKLESGIISFTIIEHSELQFK